jgi:hypothetical protein
MPNFIEIRRVGLLSNVKYADGRIGNPPNYVFISCILFKQRIEVRNIYVSRKAL